MQENCDTRPETPRCGPKSQNFQVASMTRNPKGVIWDLGLKNFQVPSRIRDSKKLKMDMRSWTPEVEPRMLMNNLLAKKFKCCYKSYFHVTEKLNLKQLKITKNKEDTSLSNNCPAKRSIFLKFCAL